MRSRETGGDYPKHEISTSITITPYKMASEILDSLSLNFYIASFPRPEWSLARRKLVQRQRYRGKNKFEIFVDQLRY